MNKILACLAFLLGVSCNSTPRNNNMHEEPENAISTVQPEEFESIEAPGPVWKYSYNDQKENFELTQVRTVDNDTLSGEFLAAIINHTYPKVQVDFIKISNDTAFIAIPESEVLTRQMGSAGAEGFLITATWTFTELKGVRHVDFDFVFGDHATPGVYSRSSWEIKHLNKLQKATGNI